MALSNPFPATASIYTTPGMGAFGCAGFVPDDDPKYAGLQIAYAARTAAIIKVRLPSFGYLTVLNRKRGGTSKGGCELIFPAVPGARGAA